MGNARMLKMDGLDKVRDRLDSMAESLSGWQFQMSSAPEPHPLSAIMVEGYCPELKKHSGIVLLEEHILDGNWEKQLGKMEKALLRESHNDL